MTRYDPLERIGPVQISAIVSELLGTETSYRADCDNSAACEWGIYGTRGIRGAGALDWLRQEAAGHAELCAAVYGPGEDGDGGGVAAGEPPGHSPAG